MRICPILLVLGLAPISVQAQTPPPPFAGPTAATATTPGIDAVKPELRGDVNVPLTPGTFEAAEMHASASTYIPIVGIFTSSMIENKKAAGEFSETKAPTGLKQIVMTGYSAKALGMFGKLVLCQPKVEKGDRLLKTSDFEVVKDHWKSLQSIAPLKQNSDGVWAFEIQKPLAPGHYIVTFMKSPMVYWDFDVK